MERNLVCEPCGPTVAGGYDPSTQQVIIASPQEMGLLHVFIRSFSVRTTFTLKATWRTPSLTNWCIATTTAVHMWTGTTTHTWLAQKYEQQVSVVSASSGKKISLASSLDGKSITRQVAGALVNGLM